MANQANLDDGYIALYRSFITHALFLRKPAGWCRIWLYMLCRANRIERTIDTDSGPIKLPVGAFLGSIRSIAQATSTTSKSVRCCMLWLEKNEMAAQSTTHRFTVYSVVNFDFYQTTKKDRAQSRATTGHSQGTVRAQSGQQTRGKREEVEVEEEKNLVDSAGPNATFALTGELSDNGTRKAKPKTTYTAEFSAWWEFRWRGDAKRKAELAYGGAVRYVMGKARCTDVQAHARLIAWAKDEARKSLVPGHESRRALMEATWLNGRRWEDEIREIHIEPEAGGDAFSRMVREGKFKGAVLP
jgi:hypothetical protein